MTVLIVGADRIESFVPKLKDLGAKKIVHWSARNCRSCKNQIPKKTELVIFCTDFLNHNAARQIKKQIKQRRLPAVYCRRAWSEMEAELSGLMDPGTQGSGHPCACKNDCRDCCSARRPN